MRENFIDMKNAKILNYGVVLIDNIFSEISDNIDTKEIKQQIRNPFAEINVLAIKGALGVSFTDITLPQSLDKEYQSGNFKIKSQFFPPKFSLLQNNPSGQDKNETIDMMLKIVDFAILNDKIGKIGVNFTAIIEKDIIIKDALLKDNIAKEFSGISITLVNQINELQTLNLKIAGAKNNITNQNAIFISANFENKITVNNSIETIFKQDYLSILENKINEL